MNIRPFQGQVLIELDERKDISDGGVALHQSCQELPKTGRIVAMGCWPMAKNGALIPWEMKVGDRVIINPHSGKTLRDDSDRFKLVDYSRVLGVLTEDG